MPTTPTLGPARSPAGTAETSGCCSPIVRDVLSTADAETLASTLKAVADPARLRLLSLIAAHQGAEACVCDLTEPVGLTQPTVSHHLKVLVDAGLLTRDKRGIWRTTPSSPPPSTPSPRYSSPARQAPRPADATTR